MRTILQQPHSTSAEVHAIIPAHNEERSIPETIDSVWKNGVNSVTVILDNCSDDTELVSLRHGAQVFKTVENKDKKAGALNQCLTEILKEDRNADGYLLIVDADTRVSENFLEAAFDVINADEADAIGGVFRGEIEGRWSTLKQCQENEYARYAREVMRKKRVMVLSGTASLIPIKAFKQLLASRGEMYMTSALTEDMEITLALKSLGYRLASPEECSCTTELMPTVGDLVRQRVRWYRGALENLIEYGWTPVTRRYWIQQGMLMFGAFSLTLFVVVSSISLSVYGFETSPFWLAVGAIFVFERSVTVWARGTWKGRLLAVLIIPELIYSMVLYYAFLKAVWFIAMKSEHEWSHVN